MKHKTAELTGPLLDAAVALAEGRNIRLSADRCYVSSPGGFDTCIADYRPSTDWRIGGPIIEREQIELEVTAVGDWVASVSAWTGGSGWFEGPKPLIAAMRAYVASKLGPEVTLP